jgi:ubiquinone/menaquinone biosynthesis C-methylase UbiE
MDIIQKYWDNRADTYSITVNGELESGVSARWGALFTKVINFENQESLRVLDVGTGPGFFAQLFAQKGCFVEAIDCSQGMLSKAKHNTRAFESHINFHLMDATDLSFMDETFDIVVTRNLTWTLADPCKAYAEWYRVLKSNGTLLNFDANWYAYLLDDELNKKRLKDQADNTILSHIEGCASDEQCSACELIAQEMPLTRELRPAWDMQALTRSGFSKASCNTEVWKTLWDEGEKRYYATSPLFLVAATK